MDNINGSGRRGGDFQPREIPHGSSPKSQKSQGVAVHNNLPNQTPRHITRAFPDSQRLLSRAVHSTYGQSYLKGSVRGRMLQDIEWALKNKQPITVNDDASLGSRKLGKGCQQFKTILQELKNEKLNKVDDLSFLGEEFTELFNEINQEVPEALAGIVVDLSNSIQKWHRNTDFQNVRITGERVQKLDKECKEILKIFLVAQPEDDGDSGIDSRSGSDTESVGEPIDEPEWEAEELRAIENAVEIVIPEQSVTMQRPKHSLPNSFNTKPDDDSVIEQEPRNKLPPDQSDHLRTLQDEEVIIEQGQYEPDPMTVKPVVIQASDQYKPGSVSVETGDQDFIASRKPAATQTSKPAGLQSASTEILKGELLDPELDGLKESLSQAEQTAEDLRKRVTSQTQELKEAEADALKLRSDAERLNKEMASLTDENGQLKLANQSQKEALDEVTVEANQAGDRADRAEQTAEGLRKRVTSQTQELKEAEADALKLRSDAERLNKEMASLTDENGQLKLANQSQKEALDEVTVEANQAGDRADRAEQTAEGLRKRVTSQMQELKEAEADALKLRSDAERLNKEMASLTDENGQLKLANQSQKEALDEVTVEANQAGDRADRAEQTAEGLRKRVTSQTQELKEAEADALKLRSDAERLNKEMASLTDENGQLKLANQSQKEGLDAAQIELSSWKEQVSSLSKADHEKQQILEETEEKFRKQSEENASLKSQLERSAEEKLVIESQRSEASSRADTLENENRGLKEELEKLRALVTSQGDQLTAFTETKNKLKLAQVESDRLKSELVTKEKQHASVIDDMKDKLEVERASFDEQITELENRISREINKQVKLGNDLKAAKSELGTQADVRTKAESRLRQVEIAMSGNLNRLERELDRSKKKSDQLESKIHEKDRKIYSLSFDSESQSVRAKSLEKEVRRVSSENAGLKNQLKSQKNQVSNAEELTNQKRRQIERERSQHQTELARVKKEGLQIKDDLDVTLDELQRVKGDKRQDGYKFAAKEQEYEAKVAELDKKIGVLNKQLKEANTGNTTAHKQVSDIKAQMVELEKERGQHKKDLGQVKSQRDQFQNDLDRVKKEKKQQGVEFSLRDKALKEQLAKSENIIEQQKLNVGSLETQINRLNAKILELEKEKQGFGNLSKDSKRIDDNLSKLRQERDQARLEARELKQVMARMSAASSQDVFKYLLREMRAANVEKHQYQAREEHRWTKYSYGVRGNEQFNYNKRLEAQLHDMRMQLQKNVERLDEVNGVLAEHGWESKAQNAISERIQKTNDKLNAWDESEPRKVLGERIQKEQNKWDRK